MQQKKEYEGIFWLPEEDYKKAIGQFRMQIAGALNPLRMYGQGEYVDMAVEEIILLAEDFGLRVRGIDKPISLELMRREQRRKEILARDGG